MLEALKDHTHIVCVCVVDAADELSMIYHTLNHPCMSHWGLEPSSLLPNASLGSSSPSQGLLLLFYTVCPRCAVKKIGALVKMCEDCFGLNGPTFKLTLKLSSNYRFFCE